MRLSVPETLHLLSWLTQLPRQQNLGTCLPKLLSLSPGLELGQDVAPTPRQLRRWQQLGEFWLAQGSEILSALETRQALGTETAQTLMELGKRLQPPANLPAQAPPIPNFQALFITQSAWGESYGTSCELSLRKFKLEDRFPPLYLSARLADAAMLSSGHLALEALSHWLGQKLALAEPFPLWAELAFPDHLRLMDESAALAFAGTLLEGLFESNSDPRAWSGLVRRDGQIEPVQGFDLAYSKLDAAFDAQIDSLFLPAGTPLRAYPEAGIRLQKGAGQTYHYFLETAPEDVMTVHCVSDLDQLFVCGFAPESLNRLSQKLIQLPPQQGSALAHPSLSQWRELSQALMPHLPPKLAEALDELSQLFVQAHEMTQAGLNHTPVWQECGQALLQWLQDCLAWIALTLCHQTSQAGSYTSETVDLRPLRAPHSPAERLTALTQASGKALLEQCFPGQKKDFLRFFRFCQSLLGTPPAQELSEIWAQFRYLIHSAELPSLFQVLSAAAQNLHEPDGVPLEPVAASAGHSSGEPPSKGHPPSVWLSQIADLHQQAQAARKAGKLDQALTLYQSLVPLLEKEPEKQGQWLGLYREMGQIAQLTHNRDWAEEIARHALFLARESQDPLAIAACLVDLAQIEENADALALLEQARLLAEPNGPPPLLFQIYKALGQRIAEKQASNEAMVWFYKALGQTQPQSLEMAALLETMSYEAIRTGQVQMAENDLLLAKQIYAHEKDAEGLASVYNRLGTACFYQQEYKRARYYFAESKAYLEQSGNLKRLSHVNHNLGLLCEALREYDQAEVLFSQNQILAHELGELRIEGLALNQRASVALKLRKMAAAQQDLHQAERLLKKAKDRRGLAYVALNQGLWGILSGELPLAGKALLKAEAALRELQDIMGQDLVTLRLGHCFFLQGAFAQAEKQYQTCLASRKILDARQSDGLERVYHALALVAFKAQQWETAQSYLKEAEAILLKTRELSHLAICLHNQALIALHLGQAHAAEQLLRDRDLYRQLDPYGIAQDFSEAELALMLD